MVAVAGDWGGVRRDIDAALSAWSGGLQEDTTVAPTPTEATGLVQVRSCDPDSVNNFAHLLLSTLSVYSFQLRPRFASASFLTGV